MDFRDTPEDAAFREDIQAFLHQELPPGLARRGFSAMFGGRTIATELTLEEMRDASAAWAKKLSVRGWIAPAWPKEYGGAGMTVMQQFIFNQEMATAGAPRGANIGIGVGWAGPTIILYGNEDQKKKYLPPILRGEAVWCQGFSEPEAGSDLAALQTRAIRDGDDYVINGQKIWTSGAHIAKHMILLARTDPDAPKHKGISYFVVDMDSPGITIRPLVNMANNHDFNEVFLENVRVPKDNLVGEENRGWYIAAATLDFERSNIATSVHHTLMVEDLLAYVREHRGRPVVRDDSRTIRAELMDRYIESRVGEMLSYNIISVQARGVVPNKEASVAKLFGSELDYRIAITAMKTMGLYSQLDRGSAWAELNGSIESMYLYATTSPVGGGTSEIQRNIIAMRGLGLPRG